MIYFETSGCDGANGICLIDLDLSVNAEGITPKGFVIGSKEKLVVKYTVANR